MKKLKILYMSLIITKFAFAQCPEYDLMPPSLSNVVVRSVISKTTLSPIYTYRYSITNGVSSSGCIHRFEIDVSYPLNGVELSDSGLVDYPGYVDRSALQLNPNVRVIPVGIPKLPGLKGFRTAWSAGFSVKSRVDWGSVVDQFRLAPGETIDSILMMSHGLPSLRSFVISPSYNPLPPVIVTPENEDSVYLNVPPLTREEEEAFQRLEDSIKVRGITIGPTAQPAIFNGLNFLDTIKSYITQSRALGWITNDPTANKYTRLIDTARFHLQANNRGVTKAKLDSVLINVYPDSAAGAITSEAYALLRFNTEYVLKKLDEE